VLIDSTPQVFPDFSRERELMRRGARHVAGIDEAGRGPLAGPVVVAGVILDPDDIPAGLNDSKKLTAAAREALFDVIMSRALASSVVIAPPNVILSRNIRGATLWAMAEAAHGLSLRPDRVLVDGRDIPPGLPCDGVAVIGGDAASVSIAAASILAKVTRDRMCAIMDCDAPLFGFAQHKGYGSPQHLHALRQFGPCRHHRNAFAPVAEALQRLVPETEQAA
jgi:ribonuclease HII